MRLYFAYGSNMSVQQMRARCPGAVLVGPAELHGWRFFVNRRGTASIKPNRNSVVHGLVWRVGPTCRKTLDRFEGIRLGHYFVRHVTLILDGHHGHPQALGFVYVGAHLQEGRPVRAYLDGVVIPAAERAALPKAYVDELRSWLPRMPIGPHRPRRPGRSWRP